MNPRDKARRDPERIARVETGRAQWIACGPVCKLHTYDDPAICGERRPWIEHERGET